jgi:formylmethanofuran dehydrogenase subunit C
MIAGSVFVFGQPGIRLGAGMKRGTIALFGGRPQLLPTFRYDCDYRPVFIQLYLRQLCRWGFAAADQYPTGLYRRFSGDLVALGKGEVLYWQGP